MLTRGLFGVFPLVLLDARYKVVSPSERFSPLPQKDSLEAMCLLIELVLRASTDVVSDGAFVLFNTWNGSVVALMFSRLGSPSNSLLVIGFVLGWFPTGI